MRNLKRALSLALASVMLLGMMVVGTSAASYPDVDSNDNVEAIEVLNAVEVMIGDRGNFRPDSPVNRHEMAAIMARLYLGKDAAENYVGSHPFTDVYPWADKYVAACYENGLINGTSKTTFSGNQPLTAIQAAAMMLRALGYEDLSKGAADWRTPVAAKANQIRLFKDVVSASNAQLTRNEVAQLALNTLKSTMVTTKKGTNIDLGEIGSITTDREYTPREVDVTRANDPAIAFDPGATVPGKYALQLGEDLYDGKLKLVAGNDDDFGRPGDSRWTYDGKEVYNVVKDATATFTAKTSNANVLKALKGYEYNGKKISVENDVKAIADETANGKLVEVFVSDNEIIKVVKVTYTVAKVTNVSTNKDGDVSYTLDNNGGTGRDYADPDKDDTIVIDGSVAKDDIVTYAKAGNVLYVYPTTNFVGAQSSFKTSTRAGTIVVNGTTYDVGTGLTNVAQDGTDGKFPNSDDDATFYVDQFGYVVKSDAVETNTEYAVIDAIIYKAADGLDGKPYAQANLILADGTKVGNAKVVKINGLDLTKDAGYSTATAGASGSEGTNVKISTHASDKVNGESKVTALALCPTVADNAGFKGMIVAYSEDKGEYTLTIKNIEAGLTTALVCTTAGGDMSTSTSVIAATAKTTLDNNKTITTKDVPSVLLGSAVTTDGKTVYVVKTGSDKWSTYTGFRNVPTIKTGASTAAADKVTVSVVVKDGKAEFVYIDASATNAVNGEDSGDIMYLVSKTPTTSGKDKDLIYEAIVNGEKTTVKVKNGTSAYVDTSTTFSDAANENKLFTLTYNADGYVTAATSVTGNWNTGVTLTSDVSSDDGTIGRYTYDSSAKVIAIEDGEVIDGATVETAVKGDTIWVKTKGTTGADQYKIDTIYIVKDGDKAIVGTTPDAALIEAALAGDGSATLANGVTIPDGVSIPNGSKLTLSGTGSIANNVTLTVEEGGTLVIKGAVTCAGNGHIQLNGGTIEIDSADVALPVIKGDGVVSVDSGKAAGDGTSAAAARIADLKAKIGTATVSATKDLTAKTATFTIDSSNTVGVMGEGHLKSFSVAYTIDQLAARTGGDENSKVIFVELNLSGAGFTAGSATVKYNGSETYGAGTWTLTANMCSGTDTVLIPVTADVVSITVSQ